MAELITATGAEIRFLPSYSPDLNPIENIFSRLKSYLRSFTARTHDQFWNSISDAINHILPENCINGFKACGYRVT